MSTVRSAALKAGLIVCLLASPLRAGVLDSPNASNVQGPFFVQPFSFVTVDSVSAGIGETSPFFSSLPPGSFPTFQIVNILGNFQAFDSLGNPAAFDIVSVSVTQGARTFTPSFGLFNFAGMPSLTLTDSLNPLNTATFLSSDFTFAFTFTSDPSLTYSYTLSTTGLDAGSSIVYDDAEGTTPEPKSLLMVGAALAVMCRSGNRAKRA